MGSKALSNRGHINGADTGYNEGPNLDHLREPGARNEFATGPQNDPLLKDTRQHEDLGIADQTDGDATAGITAVISVRPVTSERAGRPAVPLSSASRRPTTEEPERFSTSVDIDLRKSSGSKQSSPGNHKSKCVSAEENFLVEEASRVTNPTDSVQKQAGRSAKKGSSSRRAAAKSERQLIKEEKEKKDAERLAKKQEEALEKLMTPTEYAQKLQTKFASLLAKTPASKLFLKDKCIFYTGGDHGRASQTTRNRMDFVSLQFKWKLILSHSHIFLSPNRSEGRVASWCPLTTPLWLPTSLLRLRRKRL